MISKTTHFWRVKSSGHSKKKLARTIVKKTKMMMLPEEENELVQRKSILMKSKWTTRKSNERSMP